MFGEVNTCVHSIRIFNIAILDVIGTIIGCIIIKFSLKKIFHYDISLYILLIILFGLGILLHRLFCVRTSVDKLMFDE